MNKSERDYNDIMFNVIVASKTPEKTLDDIAESLEGAHAPNQYLTLVKRFRVWKTNR